MIDEAMDAALDAIGFPISMDSLEQFIKSFLSHLPRPETPYEQAILYRELVGME